MDAAVYADDEGRKVVNGFVPVFAHPRLTSDAYGKAVSRWFDSGIQVPIVIFADPTGREIPGTRLDHRSAQVKANYLESARRAMRTFLAGRSPGKVREAWKAFGEALRRRKEGVDPGGAVADLVRLRDGSPKDDPMRASVEDFLRRINDEEAAGYVEVAKMEMEGDPAAGLGILFQVLRDFPGLPAAKEAEGLLAEAKADPERKGAHAAAERDHRARLALAAADRLARAGKKAEARKAYEALAKEFEGTGAAGEAKERLEDE